MESCIFFIVIIIISLLTNKGNTQKSNNSSNDVTDLESIFNEITQKTGKNLSNLPSSSLPAPSTPVPQPRRNRRTPIERASGNRGNDNARLLTTPTSHVNHDCEAVNYDSLGSLEGGTGSFHLGESEPTVVQYEAPKIKIGREELLKSFIISEVMQKYDINRIYSRIPSIKSDD